MPVSYLMYFMRKCNKFLIAKTWTCWNLCELQLFTCNMKAHAWQQVRIYKEKISKTFYLLLLFVVVVVVCLFVYICMLETSVVFTLKTKWEYNLYCLHKDSPKKALGSKNLKDTKHCSLSACSIMGYFFPRAVFHLSKQWCLTLDRSGSTPNHLDAIPGSLINKVLIWMPMGKINTKVFQVQIDIICFQNVKIQLIVNVHGETKNTD